ncbi:MAG: FAD:protein FMN transferase, partial [Kiritimatiellaeota bacterium]|nr:FAD:protein FMN transferase [Kiritimatiellota bacterium]
MVLSAASLFDRMNAADVQRHDDYTRLSFPALGTQNSLMFRAPPAAATGFRIKALRWLADFEARFSRYIPTSLVAQLNAGAGSGAWLELDTLAQELFALCYWFHWKTTGAFDPTVATLSRLWETDVPHAPTADDIAAALELSGWDKVEHVQGKARLPHAGMQLDFGGIGKEYAVDRVFALAQQDGIRDILVDFGRDLRVGGHPPEGGDWRLGLEHPENPDTCWSGVALSEGALCCSGDYRRFTEVSGQRYGHLVDPRSGLPAHTGVRAVWAIAPTCTEAGILTTAACILGREGGGCHSSALGRPEIRFRSSTPSGWKAMYPHSPAKWCSSISGPHGAARARSRSRNSTNCIRPTPTRASSCLRLTWMKELRTCRPFLRSTLSDSQLYAMPNRSSSLPPTSNPCRRACWWIAKVSFASNTSASAAKIQSRSCKSKSKSCWPKNDLHKIHPLRGIDRRRADVCHC